MAIKAGLVGTGYAARVRAEALRADARAQFSMVAGRDYQRTVAFAGRYGVQAAESWLQLVNDVAVDLVVVSTVSGLHGAVVEAALKAGKHVVVEYPLSLDLGQATRLLSLAAERGLLLHVEHIELLGGLHKAMRSHLPAIGVPYYVNYRTLKPQHPAPTKWAYRQDLFGFPFCGALSRVHRLINLFGKVRSVDCRTQVVENPSDSRFYLNILSSGRLLFESGLIAELTYGKGEHVWTSCRTVEVQGRNGSMAFVGNRGTVTTAAGTASIEVAPRKGLIALDTDTVLTHLSEGTGLYVSAAESVYALSVGDALRRASEQAETVVLQP